MPQHNKRKTKLFRLLDTDQSDKALRVLKSFSQDELADFLLEVVMFERVVKAKIRLLRRELALKVEEIKS